VAIGVLLLVELMIMVMLIKFTSDDTSDLTDGTLSVCGLCMLVPAFIAYLVVSGSITLAKRDVYGETHAKGIVVSFVLIIISAVMLLVGWVFFFQIFDADTGLAFYLGVPFIVVAWAWFFLMKEVGGKILSLFGALGYTAGKTMFIIGLVGVFQAAEESGSSAQDKLWIPIIGTVISMIGVSLIFVAGFKVMSWMNDHKPLIDTEQRAIMAAQQQQMQLQQRQLALQQQQLLETQKLQHQVGHSPQPDMLTHDSSGASPQGEKACLSCGQLVDSRYSICPFCQKPVAGKKPPAPNTGSRGAY